MGFWDALLRGKSSAKATTTPFELPLNVQVTVDTLMTGALLLVVVPEELQDEIRVRQRVAACAYGAADWCCQATRLQMNEMQWMQASAGLMFKYCLQANPTSAKRIDAELIGRSVAEVVAGGEEWERCIAIGASAARSWVVNEDVEAPLRVTECIMGG